MREALLSHLLEYAPREKLLMPYAGDESERVECIVQNSATDSFFRVLGLKGSIPITKAESMLANVKAQNRRR